MNENNTQVNNSKINVVLFSGGRGTSSITETFLKYPDISLTILVNAYDDGLSTGRLREFVGGMLGPSDIRKNISQLLSLDDRSCRNLQFLLDYRFDGKISFEQAIDCLKSFKQCELPAIEDLSEAYKYLNITQANWISKFCDVFISYTLNKKEEGCLFDFVDCSVGNIFFAGCFLLSNNDFNIAIKTFSKFCEINGVVLNITDGTNYVLVATKDDGTFLKCEADIVSPQSSVCISEIFLLSRSLWSNTIDDLNGKAVNEKKAILDKKSEFPEINPDAKVALEHADVIIYGPGTQNSSLFPSYLTKGVSEAIASNNSAEKIFVANIRKDYEIQGENVNSLTKKFFYNISRKGSIEINKDDIVTTFFFQKDDQDVFGGTNSLLFDQNEFDFPIEKVKLLDWETKEGKHAGGRVLDELLGIIQSKRQVKLKPFHYSVSIVVPGLDEEKTVKEVIHELNLLDFSYFDLGKEIIYVDGGSTDSTMELVKSEKGIRVYQVEPGKGRGAAIRLGVEKANGNIIIFFPSDREYNPKDIYQVVSSIVKNEFQVVFGSRSIKCVNLKQRNLKIYHGNYLAYWISKYGGILLSTLTLLLYNRFLSDPLTSIKGFDAKVLQDLDLTSNGINLDTEIIAKLCKKEIFILEIPVEFYPRTKIEGKKTTMFGGLKALATLVLCWFK